jgi:exopolysaccharide production protein ExoQ
MLDRPHSTSPTFPWGIFIFLFVVFVMSSWDTRLRRDGYDAADATELMETAATGSLGRQVALSCLGLYGLVTLASLTVRKPQVNGLAGAAFLAYIAWACASVLWSTDVELTSKASVRLLLMCLGALAIARRLTIRQIAHITFSISALTLLVSIVAELALGTLDPANASWRLSGVMHPVSQGWNCGLLSISAVYLSRCSSRLRRWVYRVVLVCGISCLLLTKSRMALASTLLSMVIYYLWNSTLLQRVLGVTFCGAAVCLIAFAVGNNNIQHYAAFGRDVETEASFVTLTGRIPLWEECLRYSQTRPLCGYGYNAFLSPANVLGGSDASGWMSSPHSGYIGTLFELGVIGLMLLLATLFLAIRRSVSKTPEDRDHVFVVSVLVWITINLFLEAFLITSCFFATFLAFTLLAKVSFASESARERVVYPSFM